MKKIITILAAALFIVSCYGQKADNGTYTNPVLGGDYPDPSVMRDGKDYYMTHSSFDYNPGLVVWHSTDLVNWEPISYALHTYLGSVWAPDISKQGNKYYIYFTVNKHGNWVVAADSPYGPWSDPVDLNVGQIDPCIAVAGDGTKWLYLSGGFRKKLTPDGLNTVDGTQEHVYDGWPIPEDWVNEGMCLEGPKLKKVGQWWYYLSAEGGTAGPATSHMVVVARSRSLDGPWENSPYNPLVHTWLSSDRWWSRGHGSLIDTPDGRWYIVYHAYDRGFTGLGRQTLLEPVVLGKDGWFKSSEADVSRPLPAPLPLKPFNRKSRLDEFRLGLDWKYYKEYDPARASVKNKVLTLKAQGAGPADSSPLLFVAGDHSYEFEAEVTRDPGAIAALVIFYNGSFYVGQGINGRGTLRYRRDDGSLRTRLDNATHVWLRLRNEDQVVTGYYSLDGKNWVRESWGMEISGFNHNTLGDFQSMLPGLMAAGKGLVKFSNFKYRTLE